MTAFTPWIPAADCQSSARPLPERRTAADRTLFSILRISHYDSVPNQSYETDEQSTARLSYSAPLSIQADGDYHSKRFVWLVHRTRFLSFRAEPKRLFDLQSNRLDDFPRLANCKLAHMSLRQPCPHVNYNATLPLTPHMPSFVARSNKRSNSASRSGAFSRITFSQDSRKSASFASRAARLPFA